MTKPIKALKHSAKNAGLILLSAVFISAIFSGTAASAGDTLKDEMGLTRLKVIYPEDGAAVAETRPTIGADATGLEVPLDPGTVVITVNGTDVTDNADVTPAYVTWQPAEPLAPGRYEIRITAKNLDRKDIEPLSWSFTVSAEAPSAKVETGKTDNTTGRYSVSMDSVSALYVPQAAVDVSDNFREKEGVKLNADLSFTNVTPGRTIVGAFHRETQDYTDIEMDKGRIEYYDANFTSMLGHFNMELSDLTVLGGEMAGVRIDKEAGPWDLTLFSGRTQDPSTSGTYKQITSGFRGGYNWSARHKTSLTALSAEEEDSNGIIPGIGIMPARDQIVSLSHEYRRNNMQKFQVELARNNRMEPGSTSTHNSAAVLKAESYFDNLYTYLSAYDYGEDFYPVSEGGAKYLKNDRAGGIGRAVWQVTKHLNLGGEYEQYDTHSTDVRTKRGNAFVGVSTRHIQSLRYQKTKLTSDGTESETDSVIGTFVLDDSRRFSGTRITTGWQQIEYTGAGVRTETDVLLFSFFTSYRDRLGLSISHSQTGGNIDDLLLLSSLDIDRRNTAVGLSWNIIPFKLIWSGSYELTDNGGASQDNTEEQYKSTFKYVINKKYTMNIGMGRVDYSDASSPLLNYRQNIIRIGFECRF